MTEKPNILVVCARNKKRSRTAEFLFKNDSRFHIRSAGFSPKSTRQLSEKDIIWSDLIFVMEHDQRARIRAMYREVEFPPIEVLQIPDEYEFMDDELVEILTGRINNTLRSVYDI